MNNGLTDSCYQRLFSRLTMAVGLLLSTCLWLSGQTITVDLGSEATDLYDSVGREILVRNQSGSVKVDLPPNSARVLIHTPGESTYTESNGMLLANEVPIDFRY